MRYIPCGAVRGPSLGYRQRRHRPRWRWVPVALLAGACLLLSGCAGFERGQECKAEIGPRPYVYAAGFGVIGAVIADSQPDRQKWNDDFAACLRRKRAESVAGNAP